MFLHLREKIKFIRYNRYNRRTRFDSRKISSPMAPPASRNFTRFFYFLYFTVSRLASRTPDQRDSTNFIDCSNFYQRNARGRSIKSLSGVASKKVDRMRLARRRRGSRRAFARFVSAIFETFEPSVGAARFSPNLRPTLGRVGRLSLQRRIPWRRLFFALTFAARSFRRSLDACASSQRER